MELAPALPKITRFAHVLTRSRADADDLVQRTCERALSRAAQWQPATRLECWLYRIMQTIWIDEVRARAVRARHVASVPRDELSNSVDGERQTQAKILLERVRREMLHLSETDRVLLQLVCVDGLSYREAAEILGVPIGTVMSRLSRARMHLAARLGMATGGRPDPVRPRVPCRRPESALQAA